MKDHDLDSLRLLTHQQHEQRLREAGAERLARGVPSTPQTHRRPLARINPNLIRATSTGERRLVKPYPYAAGAKADVTSADDRRHAQLGPEVRTQRRAIVQSMPTRWKLGRFGAGRLIAFLVRVARTAL
jgi:hypothetical protein